MFPCTADRYVIISSRIDNDIVTSYYNHTSISLEMFWTPLTHGFEWDEAYQYSSPHLSGIRSISTYETYTCNPAFFYLLFVSYCLLAYLLSCTVVYYGRNEYLSSYVEKKIMAENQFGAAAFYLNCLGCGTKVPVMADGSGVCPGCKRSYIDKNSWVQKDARGVGPTQIESFSTPLLINRNLRHWDKYQDNLDETVNTSKVFRVSYPLVILTMVLSFLLMIVGIILTFSKIEYHQDGIVTLQVSIGGLITHLFICVFCGYYLGRHIKKALIAIPMILVFSAIIVYLGMIFSEDIFNGSFGDEFASTYALYFFATGLLTTSIGIASVSRYYYS